MAAKIESSIAPSPASDAPRGQIRLIQGDRVKLGDGLVHVVGADDNGFGERTYYLFCMRTFMEFYPDFWKSTEETVTCLGCLADS